MCVCAWAGKKRLSHVPGTDHPTAVDLCSIGRRVCLYMFVAEQYREESKMSVSDKCTPADLECFLQMTVFMRERVRINLK
jgi:hypothetical protein